MIHALEEQVASPTWRPVFEERFVGRVTADQIHISRAHPGRAGAFAPEFAGRITPDGSRLEGGFQLPLPLRIGVLATEVLLLLNIAADALPFHELPARGFDRFTLGWLGLAGLMMGWPWLSWHFNRADQDMIEVLLRRAASEVIGPLGLVL